MKSFICHSFVFLLIAGQSAQAIESDIELGINSIGDAEMVESLEIAHLIERRFPADRYVIVFVGRSPSLIHAAFQSIDSSESRSLALPISGLGSAEDLREIYGEKFTKKISDHLKRFLPSSENLSGKKILLVDSAGTGASLQNIRDIVQENYRANNIQTLALTYTDITDTDTFDYSIDLKKEAPRIARSILQEHTDKFALYPKSIPILEIVTSENPVEVLDQRDNFDYLVSRFNGFNFIPSLNIKLSSSNDLSTEIVSSGADALEFLNQVQKKIDQYLESVDGRSTGYLPGWSDTAARMIDVSDIFANHQDLFSSGDSGSSALSQFIGNLFASKQLFQAGADLTPERRKKLELKSELYDLFIEGRERLERGDIISAQFQGIKSGIHQVVQEDHNGVARFPRDWSQVTEGRRFRSLSEVDEATDENKKMMIGLFSINHLYSAPKNELEVDLAVLTKLAFDRHPQVRARAREVLLNLDFVTSMDGDELYQKFTLVREYMKLGEISQEIADGVYEAHVIAHEEAQRRRANGEERLYTEQDIAQKARVLAAAGVPREVRDYLIRNNIVGVSRQPTIELDRFTSIELLDRYSNPNNLQEFSSLTDEQKSYVLDKLHKLILSDDREVVEKAVNFFIEKDGRMRYYLDRYLIRQFNFPADWRSGTRREMALTFASTAGSHLLRDAGGGIRTGRNMAALEGSAVLFDVIAHAYYGQDTRAPVAHYVAPGTPLGMGDIAPAIFLWSDLIARYGELSPAVEELLNSIGLPFPGDTKTAQEMSIWYREFEEWATFHLVDSKNYSDLLKLPREEMALEVLKKLGGDILSFGIPAASTAITGSILGAPVGTITGAFLGISFGEGRAIQRTSPHIMDLEVSLRTSDLSWRDLDCESMTVRMFLHNQDAQNRNFLALSLVLDTAVLATQGAVFAGAGGKLGARVSGQALLSTTLGAKLAAKSPWLAGAVGKAGLSRLGLYGAGAAVAAYFMQMHFDTLKLNTMINELDDHTCRGTTNLGSYAIGYAHAPVVRSSLCALNRLTQADPDNPDSRDFQLNKALECHTTWQDPDASNRSFYSRCRGGAVDDTGYHAMKWVKERCGNKLEQCRHIKNFEENLAKSLRRRFSREVFPIPEAPNYSIRVSDLSDEQIQKIINAGNSDLGLDRSPLAVNEYWCKKEPENCEDGIAKHSPYVNAVAQSIQMAHPHLSLDDENLIAMRDQLYAQMILAHSLHEFAQDEEVTKLAERLEAELKEDNYIREHLLARCTEEKFKDVLDSFFSPSNLNFQCHDQ